jgi:hypothetical protein
MAATEQLALRDARDRIVDLLKLGRSHPLRDVPLAAQVLTVPFDSRARIPIELSQRDVEYLLLRRSAVPATPLASVAGSGDTVFLETPMIQEDVTFEILARSARTGREARLFQTVTVKVGLDTVLDAWIRNADLLVPEGAENRSAAKRIIDHGGRPEVVIAASQEGVDYHLVSLAGAEAVLSPRVRGRGDLTEIVLVCAALQEDSELRIRATKSFEGGNSQTALLEIVLPVAVRADPAVGAALKPIAAFGSALAVTLAAPQRSARYRAHVRPLADADVQRDGVARPGQVAVAVPNEPAIGVVVGDHGGQLAPPAGFQPVGEPVAPGAGALRLELGPASGDLAIVVVAEKTHASPRGPRTSQVVLRSLLPLLVEPDRARRLTLRARMTGNRSDGQLEVSGGEPGVFYALRTAPEAPDLGLPAYFHARDAADPGQNKGVGQIAIGVDLAIARAAPALGGAAVDPAETAPLPPLLDTGPIDAGTALRIRALRARTRVSALLTESAVLEAAPSVQPRAALVDHGARGELVVSASRADERHLILRAATEAGAAGVPGNGGALSLQTDPLVADATLLVLASPQRAGGHGFERVVAVAIAVRPDPGLPVSVNASSVAAGEATSIQVGRSQPGVRYQLFAAATPVGVALEGNGGTLALPSGPIAAPTTFSVRARRAAPPDAEVVLAQTAAVTLRAPA